MDAILTIQAPSTPAIRFANTFVTLNIPRQFRSRTEATASVSKLNRVFSCVVEASKSSMDARSRVVQAAAGAMPAPLIKIWY